MARKIKLTDTRISKLKAGDVEYMVWDTLIAGFGIRVRPSGHKSYVYHRHAKGQSRKFTLGPVALGSVDEARRDCMGVWGRMQSGGGQKVLTTRRYHCSGILSWVRGDRRVLSPVSNRQRLQKTGL